VRASLLLVILVSNCQTPEFACCQREGDRKMATEFEIYKDDQGEFRWRLQDDNNKIIADSAEGYTRKESVENAIPNVKDAVARATVNDRT
jgi:uncharacterized protein